MATKTLTIMDDVYNRLKSLKYPGESFSEEIRRLTETKGSIMDLAGAWGDMGDKEAENLKETIRSMRKGTRLGELK